ncbi:hypothetical protein [uncultured Sphaerotilus sp.]|uniref:hypothetical protein n=1 Tax=uncultured Sphaerotilus sp. TaxID=474984 RepID=UPI0030CA27A7
MRTPNTHPVPALRRISTALLALGLAGAALAAPLCRAPANLLANPGFESGRASPGGSPPGWTFQSAYSGALGSWDTDVAHSGRRSVRIDATRPEDSLWLQSAAVPVNTPLFLGGWIKSDNLQRPDQPSSPGATISVLGRWDQPAPTLGTTPWHPVGMSFITDTSPLLVSARLGFWGGLATGTAWYDDLTLVPRVADAPHPRWKILLLVYPQTDAVIPGPNGTQRHVQGTSSPAELAKTAEQAKLFVERDIPALTSGNMLPTLTVRHARQPMKTLSPVGEGWWPAQGDVLSELDPAFDSVIVVWDPRVKDVATGESLWIGGGAGLTQARGVSQTYTTMSVEYAGVNGHRNVYKHEWGHSILSYFEALQQSPQPTVTNHATGSQYVNCKTGQYYVWQDETEAQPIPNSIYSNSAGFTHDYYSGTVARTEAPQTCLGIGAQAWAWGGPVTHSGSAPVFTATERVEALIAQVGALQTAGMLGPRPTQTLWAQLQAARLMLRMPRASDHARGPLQGFSHHVQALVHNGQLLPQAGALLIEAAKAAIGCV